MSTLTLNQTCFTFEKEDLSPDICHCVKTSLTALVDRGIRAVIKKGKKGERMSSSLGRVCCLDGCCLCCFSLLLNSLLCWPGWRWTGQVWEVRVNTTWLPAVLHTYNEIVTADDREELLRTD